MRNDRYRPAMHTTAAPILSHFRSRAHSLTTSLDRRKAQELLYKVPLVIRNFVRAIRAASAMGFVTILHMERCRKDPACVAVKKGPSEANAQFQICHSCETA